MADYFHENLNVSDKAFGFNKDRLAYAMLQYLKQSDMENSVPYSYIDSTGHMTIGVGHMIPNKEEFMKIILYTDPNGSHIATKQQKEDAWRELMYLKKAHEGHYQHYGAGYYGEIKNNSHILYMSPKDIDEDTLTLINRKIDEMVSPRYFPSIKYAPFSAQKALLDMVYNLGASGALHKSHLFRDAIRSADWTAAAAYCYRANIGNYRNMQTKKLFLEASQAENIARIQKSDVMFR